MQPLNKKPTRYRVELVDSGNVYKTLSFTEDSNKKALKRALKELSQELDEGRESEHIHLVSSSNNKVLFTLTFPQGDPKSFLPGEYTLKVSGLSIRKELWQYDRLAVMYFIKRLEREINDLPRTGTKYITITKRHDRCYERATIVTGTIFCPL